MLDNLYIHMTEPLGNWKPDGPFGIWTHLKHKEWSIVSVEPGYALMKSNRQRGKDFQTLKAAMKAGDKLIAKGV